MPGGVAGSLTSTAMEISLVHFTLCQDSVFTMSKETMHGQLNCEHT